MRHIETIVRSVWQETADIKRFELADPDDWDLPPFKGGAHIDVHLADGLVRQYSLCGDPGEIKRYSIAVKREPDGRGGSRRLFDEVAVGDTVPVSPPRNHFPMAPAASNHVFVAGGIGVTPFLAMAAELSRRAGPFRLLMCARDKDSLPFRDEVERLVAEGRASIHFSDNSRLDLAAAFAAVTPGTHLYCCGPERMIAAFEAATAHWPVEQIHIERFAPPAGAGKGSNGRFRVELARTGLQFEVEPGQTILDGLRRAGITVDASCEGGVCGTCRVPYLAGKPVHRDFVLHGAERGTHIMACVSGCESDCLVLDL